MAKCFICQKRKAKRYCIAIGESICSLCCGMRREKDIHCPPSCTYLEKHKNYQDKRTHEKTQKEKPFSPDRKDILSDERLAWLAFNIEMPIAQAAVHDTSLTDGDVMGALDYAHERVKEASQILISSDNTMRPQNNLGEAVFQSIQKCRFEKSIIMPGEHQSYNRDEKLQCLERVVLSVKHTAGEKSERRQYIRQLAERFSQIGAFSSQQKLVMPK